MTQGPFIYRIDAHDRIDYVNPAFVAFARQNGLADAAPERFVGQNLFKFIGGAETEQIYRALVDRVRREDRPLSVRFRCDGPDIRRFFRLTMSPAGDRGVSLTVDTERLEPRAPLALFNPSPDPEAGFLPICSWCKDIKVDGRWLPVEAGVDRLGLFQMPRLPRLTHGICDLCLAKLSDELDGHSDGGPS